MPLSTTPTDALTFSALGSLTLGGAEIAAFDPGSDRLYVTSGVGLQVVDLSNPAAPALIGTIDFTTRGFATTDVTSVAAKNGVVAVALPASPKGDPGRVIFLDAATGGTLGSATVGSLPDMLTFTPDGTRVLVANEGEYLDSNGGPGTADGSASIIDISGGFGGPLPVATTGFGAFDADALRAAGVRIALGQTAARDLEPEYIAVSPDGATAMVTLQEANAVGLLDIGTATFTDIVPLGEKDFSTLLADFSDRDGPGGGYAVRLETGNPVLGLYMPDAVDAYEAGGQTYYVVANEGDDRNDFLAPGEVIRLNSPSYVPDPTAFPDAATLKLDAELGRLNVVNTPGLNGDTDGDGDIDRILTLGGRSFSILDSTGTIVFDSADVIERIAADLVASGDVSLATFDDRSDNKGPEPEGIELAQVGGRTYAFVGLERANVTLAFDVTDPADVTYTGVARRAGDLAPEGVLFIPAADSPTGEALLVASNEGSSTVSVFEVAEAPPAPPYTLQILHASDFEAGIEATTRAKNFAAIVDALEDTVANSITLSSGDNFIPGPFTAAGTDPSVRDEVAGFYEQLLGLAPGSLTGIRTGTLPFNAADIAVLNAIGVQASTIGNHEFDLGPTALANAFDFTATLPALPSQPTLGSITNIGAQFPYLSANLDFSGEPALAPLFTAALRDAASYATAPADLADGAAIRAEANDRQVAPWTTIQEGGEAIGVLGLTTQVLASISTVGGVRVLDPAGDGGVDNVAELAAVIQPYVDQMTAQGINKIILMSHLQAITNELALAPLLRDVDVLIGGGSNTIFADATDRLDAGDTAQRPYPVFLTGADGRPIAVVNTDGNYNYVGRLVVSFDEDGVIIPDSVDPAVSGAYVTDDAGVDAVAGNGDGVLDAAEQAAIFADGTRGGEVKQITDAIQAVVIAKDSNVVGFTDVFLEGRRNEARSEETNLGDLTADANLAVAKSFDLSTVISIKNGGGIRAEIGTIVGQPVPEELPPQANPLSGKPEGGISQLDIENALRFNNTLSLITLTAQGVLNMVENALRAAGPGLTPGSFPQVSGLKFSWDKDRPVTDRVVDLVVVDQQGDVVDVVARDGNLVGDPAREFRVVTLNFLAEGGDGIIVNAASATQLEVYDAAADLDRVDLVGPAAGFETVGAEQAALADTLRALYGTPGAAFDVTDTTPALDERIQNLDVRAGDVVGAGPVAGAGLNDIVVGTSLANLIRGGAGDDSLYGVGGDDTLLGEAGVDRLAGGVGADELTGGPGADIFVLEALPGADLVTDFEDGVDRVDARGVFADFDAVRAALVAGSGGTLIVAGGGGTAYLYGVGIAELTAADFVF